MATKLLALVALSSLAACCFTAAQTTAVATATKNCTAPGVISAPTFSSGHRLQSPLTLSIEVSEKGLVDAPKIVKSSGDFEFDGIAIDNVRKWKFKPAVCEGKAASARIVVKVNSPN